MRFVITQGNRTAAPASPGAVYFIFGLFALSGLIFAVIGIKTFMKAETSKYWIPVDGKVISSQVTSHRSSKGGTTYGPEVVYEYEFHGALHKGNKISIMSWSSSDISAAERAVALYVPGTVVRVYVNPDDPYEALLKTGTDVGVFLFIIFGFIFGGFGVIGLMNAPKMIAGTQAQDREAPDQTPGGNDALSRL